MHSNSKGRASGLTTRTARAKVEPTLSLLIWDASRLLTQVFAAGMAAHGINAGTFALLHALHEQDGVTQQELRGRVRLQQSSTTQAIEKLERQGLLQRVVDPSDRRQAHIYLTEAGRSLYRSTIPTVAAHNRLMIIGISDPDVSRIRHLFRRIRYNTSSSPNALPRDSSTKWLADVESEEMLAETTGFLLWDAGRCVTREFISCISKFDLNIGSFALFAAVCRREGIIQQELLDEVRVKGSSATLALEGLQKKGLLRRVNSQHDRRRVHVYVTAKGWHLHKRVLPEVADFDQTLTQGFSETDRKIAIRVLGRMRDNLLSEGDNGRKVVAPPAEASQIETDEAVASRSSRSKIEISSVVDLSTLDLHIDHLSMRAGWNLPTRAVAASRKKLEAHRWRSQDARAALSLANFFVRNASSQQRSLALLNPGEASGSGALQTLAAVYHLVKAGETLKSDRFMPNTLRFIVDGQGFHAVNGRNPVPTGPGDVIFIPQGSTYSYINADPDDCLWIDFIDSPLVHLLEPAPPSRTLREIEPVKDNTGQSRHLYHLRDIEAELPKSAVSGHWGSSITLDTSCLRTIGLSLHLLNGHARAHRIRTTTNNFFVAARGSGRTMVGPSTLQWSQGDVIAVPAWQWFQHVVNTDALLLRVSDEPVRKTLGLFMEQVEAGPADPSNVIVGGTPDNDHDEAAAPPDAG
jgi:gentisate 1,2-dioxygenase